MEIPPNAARHCGSKPFSFRCHPDIPCFTECCRELELALTPYDVLRLSQELQMSGSAFIDRYVVVEQDDQGGFPQLYLGMVDDGRASCPFVSAKGCMVYAGRPGACRAYPVGRGVTLDGDGKVRAMYVLVREVHCLGFAGPQSRNIAEWFENQGLIEYNAINDEVLRLLQHEQMRRGRNLTPEEKDTFILALYKLDQFRKLVSSPHFRDKYLPRRGERESVLADDLSLLRFGIRWLQEVLFAEKS